MKFGLHYEFRNPTEWRRPFPSFYQEVIEQIVYAEELGYHSIWLSEHHFVDDGYLPAVWPVAGAIAQCTRRIKIGTSVLLLPLHHPVEVAESAAVVDILSNGRFMLGVGLGYRASEFESFGISPKTRGSRIEEGLEIVKRSWTEDSFSFQGRHFSLRNISLRPKPVQKPHPPIFVGARAEVSARRAARFGCNLLLAPGGREAFEGYVSCLREQGRDLGELEVWAMRTSHVAYDPEAEWVEIQDHVMYRERQYAEWFGQASELPVDQRIREMGTDPERVKSYYFVGTPDECIENIESYRRRTPVTGIILTPLLPGLDPRKAQQTIELFAKEVMPHFAASSGRNRLDRMTQQIN